MNGMSEKNFKKIFLMQILAEWEDCTVFHGALEIFWLFDPVKTHVEWTEFCSIIYSFCAKNI